MSLVVIGTTGSSSCSRSSIADDGRTEGLRVSLVLMGTTGRSYSNGLECWASWVGVTQQEAALKELAGARNEVRAD